MIDFWFKTETVEEEMIPDSGEYMYVPRFPDTWNLWCSTGYRHDDGSWTVRLYLDHDTWDITMPSYGEHRSDTGAATSIAASSPHDWTAEEVNQSFMCGVDSTHYEPSDT